VPARPECVVTHRDGFRTLRRTSATSFSVCVLLASVVGARATSGRSAPRSPVGTSTVSRLVSLRASPSHLPGRLGPPHRPCFGHMPCYAQALSLPGKSLELHKLVAGAGFEPATSGYEQAERRPSPSSLSPDIACDLAWSTDASPCLTMCCPVSGRLGHSDGHSSWPSPRGKAPRPACSSRVR
jgi:hypothetical protein